MSGKSRHNNAPPSGGEQRKKKRPWIALGALLCGQLVRDELWCWREASKIGLKSNAGYLVTVKEHIIGSSNGLEDCLDDATTTSGEPVRRY
jgi:hypothetical protein